MKPTQDTVHHWTQAQIASQCAEVCSHFGMSDKAAEYADKAREHRLRVNWAPHRDTDETGFDV